MRSVPPNGSMDRPGTSVKDGLTLTARSLALVALTSCVNIYVPQAATPQPQVAGPVAPTKAETGEATPLLVEVRTDKPTEPAIPREAAKAADPKVEPAAEPPKPVREAGVVDTLKAKAFELAVGRKCDAEFLGQTSNGPSSALKRALCFKAVMGATRLACKAVVRIKPDEVCGKHPEICQGRTQEEIEQVLGFCAAQRKRIRTGIEN